MKYQLRKSQQLKCSLEKAWSFFSSPNNLSQITPEDLKLMVLTDVKDSEIHEGMIIEYTVSPVFRIPFFWRTQIAEVIPNHSFTDIQIKGPYKSWIHKHEFISNNQGVLMIDTVFYEPPLGYIGTIAHKFFIKNKLIEIFDYRKNAIHKLFHSNFEVA
jgi:ligand-binding SRPBCC domain-containing protein